MLRGRKRHNPEHADTCALPTVPRSDRERTAYLSLRKVFYGVPMPIVGTRASGPHGRGPHETGCHAPFHPAFSSFPRFSPTPSPGPDFPCSEGDSCAGAVWARVGGDDVPSLRWGERSTLRSEPTPLSGLCTGNRSADGRIWSGRVRQRPNRDRSRYAFTDSRPDAHSACPAGLGLSRPRLPAANRSQSFQLPVPEPAPKEALLPATPARDNRIISSFLLSFCVFFFAYRARRPGSKKTKAAESNIYSPCLGDYLRQPRLACRAPFSGAGLARGFVPSGFPEFTIFGSSEIF